MNNDKSVWRQVSLFKNKDAFILFIKKIKDLKHTNKRKLQWSFVRTSRKRIDLFQLLLQGTSVYIITFQRLRQRIVEVGELKKELEDQHSDTRKRVGKLKPD